MLISLPSANIIKHSFVFKLPAIKKLFVEHWDEPNADLLEFLKCSSPVSTKILTFGWSMSDYKPIEYYLDGLEVALKGDKQEVIVSTWVHSKESLQRVVRAAAGASKFVIRWSKISLEEDLDFSGPDYKIQVRVIALLGSYAKEVFLLS